MINSFLIISCTGKNNSIGLKTNNKFFIQKLQNNINSNNQLVSNILSFINKHKVKLNGKYSIIVNMGPGKLSGIKISISAAKAISLSKGIELYGFKADDIVEDKYEKLLKIDKKNFLINNLIKPLYSS